jgi:menaquinone-dependent protoporphyrinogen IX oxidase
MPAVTVLQLENAATDVEALGAVVNGLATDPPVATRTGPTVRTLADIVAEIQSQIDASGDLLDGATGAVTLALNAALQAANDAAAVSGVDTGRRASQNIAKSQAIAAGIQTLYIDHFAPTYAQLATLTGPVAYVRASLVDILAAGYPAASYFRHDTDRGMPDLTTDATNGGYFLLNERNLKPDMFGLFTSETVTTATLMAATTFMLKTGRQLELSGDYAVNGPITPIDGTNGGKLNLRLNGRVTITVGAAAATFHRFIYTESTTKKSHMIHGPGTLTIDLAEKAAAGIWLRHTEAATGGKIFIDAPVHVKNVKSPAGGPAASGVITLGRFERIVMRSTTVEDVTRTDAAGESAGISISDFDGDVELYSPVVRRIYCGPSSTNDADCIKCFGLQPGYDQSRRKGSVRIYSPIMEDSQVRLYKDQCGNTIIYGAWGRRTAVDGVAGSFGAANSVDFDFQFGNGILLDARIEYVKSASGGSPLGSSHSVIAFQQKLDDSEMHGLSKNLTILTDVLIPRIVAFTTNVAAAACTTELDGMTIIPTRGLVTGCTERSYIEFDAAVVGAKPTPTNFIVRNVRGPSALPVIGYTSYAALDSGTATAGAASTLTDSGKTWTVNVYAGLIVRITAGTGSGQTREIISNTASALNVAAAWTVTPDATSVYSIWYSFATTSGHAPLIRATATAGAASTLTDSTQAWTTNQQAGRVVYITSGTGAGQTRTIASNTATVLTVSAAWATNPDATSLYSIWSSAAVAAGFIPVPGGNGTATAGAASTLTDSAKAWTVNEQAGRFVRITAGTGAGQVRVVASNTATVLTTTVAWSVNPDATSVYSIWSVNTSPVGTATAATATTLTDSLKTWVASGFVERNVRIVSGTGLGQTRRITANTATELTVSAAWSVTPDATSVYEILVPKLSIEVDKCSTTMPVTGNSTRAFSTLSGSTIVDPGSFMIGDNPGYRNWYTQFVCPETMRAGCKMVLYLDSDDTEFLDTDLNTPLTGGSVPWGTTGMLYLEGKGLSNFSVAPHDTIIEARLNNATVSPSAWFTQNGGNNWGALN